jgi:hypothetical protein
MTEQKESTLDVETARGVDSQCLVVEMSGQIWHVPFETLQAIPRMGETIRLADGSAGNVTEVEYEFAPQAAPVSVAKEMPSAVSYARPVRIVIRLS